jgi:Single-strand binding protein family
MNSTSAVIVIGNLGANPNIRALPSRQNVANFSLATTERFTDRNGAKQERTDWHRIVATSKNPANVLNSILCQEPDSFKRSPEGRWTLTEIERAKAEDSNGTKETPHSLKTFSRKFWVPLLALYLIRRN